jgi:hypothetical protein
MKKIGDITLPDARVHLFKGKKQNFEFLSRLYSDASYSSLVSKVPNEIKELWELAQYLYIYSYYCYEFIPIARLHSLFCLEAAFKDIVYKKTKKHPKNFAVAIDRLDLVFGKNIKLQKKWLKLIAKIRDLHAHPKIRTLEMWHGVARFMKEVSIIINGLYFFDEPHLILPVRALFDFNEFYNAFRTPAPKMFHFISYYDNYVHSSRGEEFILKCNQNHLAIMEIAGSVESPGVLEGGVSEYSVLLKSVGGNTWESFKNKRALIALEKVKKWNGIENLYLQFELLHKEEWFLNKMGILKEEKNPF